MKYLFKNLVEKYNEINETAHLKKYGIDRARYFANKEKQEKFFKDYGIKNANHQIRDNYEKLRNNFSKNEIQLINDEREFPETFEVGMGITIFTLRKLWGVCMLAIFVVALACFIFIFSTPGNEFSWNTVILIIFNVCLAVEFFRQGVRLLKIYKLQKKLNSIAPQ